MITEKNVITGEVRKRLEYVKLGNIMLKANGAKACKAAYSTTDPEWVGRYALAQNDINTDGTMN